MVCKKWFLSSTNAQGWKVHLKKQHNVLAAVLSKSLSGAGDDKDTPSQQQSLQLQQTITKRPFPPHVFHNFENAIVYYVIGGDISLCTAGEPRFQQLVCSLTDGYVPLSTCTILRRTVELFNIAQPLIAKFLCNLNVRISLTMDG